MKARPAGANLPTVRPAGMAPPRAPHPNSTAAGRKRVEECIKRHGGICRVCRQIPTTPHVHHIDGDRDNNTQDNLALVCLHCHYILHAGRFDGSKPMPVPPLT